MGIKVQHAELPDNLLHEPKGASTASKDTVYIADGAGKGSFKQIDFSIVNFSKGTVDEVVPVDVPDNYTINGAGLLQVPTGMMKDLPYGNNLTIDETNNINKNFVELYKFYEKYKEQLAELETNITNLQTTLNTLIDSLKTSGVLNNG